VLAYCGFLADEALSLPATGVNQSAVNILRQDRLRLLWSAVDWPFEQTRLQQSALEFHQVIHHVFQQAAVVPFRLLSIFDDVRAFESFAAEHATGFMADLERLREFVQMESVVYVIAGRAPADLSSGRAYLEQKAGLERLMSEHAAAVQKAIKPIIHEVRVRDVKNGKRIFALLPRGEEDRFRDAIERVALQEPVSRRVSGPWPAAEFLSDTVKSPQVAGRR
jgi:hypothetical protein